MKKSLRSLLIGSALLSVPQIASASLLVAYYDFNGDLNTSITPEAPHFADIASGFTSKMIETHTSHDIGGSTDTYLGDSNFRMGITAYDDGYAAITSTTNPGLTMTLTNGTGASYTLSNLYYDAASSLAKSGSRGLDIAYQITGDAAPTSLYAQRSIWQYVDTFGDFGDYSNAVLDLLDTPVVLDSGKTISFFFTMVGASQEIRIDNIGIEGALTAIPEPGSFLALGGLLGSGALLRRRRRLA